jgi:hypothetical protein
VCPVWADAAANTKLVQTRAVLAVIDQTASFAGREIPRKERRKKLDRLLRAVKSPTELVQIVVIAHTLAFPQNAGDERVDDWFEDCFRLALTHLDKIPGPEADDAFDSLESLLRLDGGERLMLDEMRQRRRERHVR